MQLSGVMFLGAAGRRVDFRVLGPLEVCLAGEAVDIGHPRQRAVLAVLLLDLGRVVPAYLLIDRVWGDDPPASVRNVLYGYVARLRTVIAGAADPGVTLARDYGGYRLQVRPEQVDLWRFRRLVTEAVQAHGDDGRGAGLLRQALNLWRGPALTGTESPWLNAMRRALESERFAAELDLNDMRLRQGEHAVLATELAGQAAAAPGDERLTGQLMLALWRSGRPSEALRCFDQARNYLADELGADPGPQLRALHEQILRADSGLAWPGQGSSHRAPVPHELPADVPGFGGRARELGQLDQLLLRPAGKEASSESAATTTSRTPVSAAVISAVSGTAGVGKTALALHWAHHAAGAFPDGQLYADLHGYDVVQPLSPADVLAGFLRALGADVPPSADERAARYRSLLAGRRMLIVLDNATTAEQVRPLLPGAPSCATIVTSRDALAGLVARDGAARLELDLLPLADATDLLRELIGPRADADPGATAELAVQCACLPLALRVSAELATARGEVPLASLVAELRDQRRRLDMLDAAGDPHTAVRAVFSWSYRNLDSDAARTFRLAGLYPGTDFDSYAVAALNGISQERAAQLVSVLARAHLLQPAGSARYGLHDLLRAYARELAAEEGQEQALTQLLDYYLFTAAAAMDIILPGERDRRPRIQAPLADIPALPDLAAARHWLDDERATLIALIGSAAEGAWLSQATQLAGILFRYLDYGSHYAEAAAIHDLICQAARRAGDPIAEAEALISLGVAEIRQGRHQQAAERHRRALALSRQAGYQAGIARALNNLGLACYRQGRYAEAADLYQQALTACHQVGDQASAANVLGNLAAISQRQGHDEQATGHLEQALPLFRDTGNRDGEATVLGMLADIGQRQDDCEQAVDYLQQALKLFGQTGNRDGEASAWHSLAEIDQRQHHYQQAVDHLQRALDLFRTTGNQHGETVALNGLGRAFLAAGQWENARLHYSAALGQAGQAGHTDEQAYAHNGLGDVYRAADDVPQARYHWQQALALYTKLGVPEASHVQAQLLNLEGLCRTSQDHASVTRSPSGGRRRAGRPAAARDRLAPRLPSPSRVPPRPAGPAVACPRPAYRARRTAPWYRPAKHTGHRAPPPAARAPRPLPPPQPLSGDPAVPRAADPARRRTRAAAAMSASSSWPWPPAGQSLLPWHRWLTTSTRNPRLAR
jgi:DNA-binding SARP family transcriptional activator/tetratricopeptide (TPR) repeat protein